MSFSEILKNLRAEKGVTQKEVAYACGFTPTCICQLESGTRNPTGSTIKELANYFACSADFLLELENDFGQKSYSPAVPALSDDERQLLDLYQRMNHQQKIRAVAYCEGLLSTSDNISRRG